VSLLVRSANENDVPAVSRVLIASITELCRPDHHDDPDAISAWIANKSEDGVRQMLVQAEVYIADREGMVVGVGALKEDKITLNYVDPAHRGTGVSRALLVGLEQVLSARGVRVAHLESTTTARHFYLSQGWTGEEPSRSVRLINSWPMRKVLQTA
jgi:GNAT superfamily N-acetyltransferase